MPISPLSRFRALIADGRYARAYDYSVSFLDTPVDFFPTDDLDMRCETFSFPSQNIETTQDNIRIGPIREHAFSVNYGSVTGTFLVDENLKEKRFFEDWQRKIFDTESFKVEYYDTYVADIRVKQFNQKRGAGSVGVDGPSYQVLLKEAFPKTVTQLDVGTANGEFLRVSVEFQYHHWIKEI